MLNLGYVGNLSRQTEFVISNRTVGATSAPIKAGQPVILSPDNTVTSGAVATLTAANFEGIAIREVKQSTIYNDSTVEYAPKTRIDVATKGQVTVRCGRGTPTAGGAVYVRVAANATYPNSAVGDFEATADSTNSIQLTNAKWTTGRIDGNLTAEVSLLTRVNP
jgi:hypothetical protein